MYRKALSLHCQILLRLVGRKMEGVVFGLLELGFWSSRVKEIVHILKLF